MKKLSKEQLQTKQGLIDRLQESHADLDEKLSLILAAIDSFNEAKNSFNNILSDVEIISADYINQAYDRTVASDVKYRFVIDAKTF